jgi:putative endonuclease
VRNFRCPAGEIDIICSDGETLVFVEVKTRSSADPTTMHGGPRNIQWKRIESAARYVLMQKSAQNRPCRFDAITVDWPARGSPQVEHYQDAYQAGRK